MSLTYGKKSNHHHVETREESWGSPWWPKHPSPTLSLLPPRGGGTDNGPRSCLISPVGRAGRTDRFRLLLNSHKAFYS